MEANGKEKVKMFLLTLLTSSVFTTTFISYCQKKNNINKKKSNLSLKPHKTRLWLWFTAWDLCNLQFISVRHIWAETKRSVCQQFWVCMPKGTDWISWQNPWGRALLISLRLPRRYSISAWQDIVEKVQRWMKKKHKILFFFFLSHFSSLFLISSSKRKQKFLDNRTFCCWFVLYTWCSVSSICHVTTSFFFLSCILDCVQFSFKI